MRYIPQNSFDPWSKVTNRTYHHSATLNQFEIFLPALAIGQNMETRPFLRIECRDRLDCDKIFRESDMIEVYQKDKETIESIIKC